MKPIYISVIAAIIMQLHQLSAQEISHYNNTYFNPIEREIYRPNTQIHTSVRSYNMDVINTMVNVDSLLKDGLTAPIGKLNFWQRIFKKRDKKRKY